MDDFFFFGDSATIVTTMINTLIFLPLGASTVKIISANFVESRLETWVYGYELLVPPNIPKSIYCLQTLLSTILRRWADDSVLLFLLLYRARYLFNSKICSLVSAFIPTVSFIIPYLCHFLITPVVVWDVSHHVIYRMKRGRIYLMQGKK